MQHRHPSRASQLSPSRLPRFLVPTLLLLAAAVSACAQTAPNAAPAPATAPVQTVAPPSIALDLTLAPQTATQPAATAAIPASIQPLLAFRDADVKFRLPDLMDILRDRRHEGWVLAAYPDPKTGRPLIGAGFSLDLPERPHPQTDPLNPNAFVEPSSAQLWQAAGLDPARLQTILGNFQENADLWRALRRHHRRIPDLPAEITDDDAAALLRIAAIQAIQNARAYCRTFDQLTGPQQMALTQLVYQMGVNLSEFGQFLNLINHDPAVNNPGASLSAVSDSAPLAVSSVAPSVRDSALSSSTSAPDPQYWGNVEDSLIQSQWARLYRARAIAVIAMLDPRYADDPSASEQRVADILHPVRHRRGSTRATLRTAAYRSRSGHSLSGETLSGHTLSGHTLAARNLAGRNLTARRASRTHTRRKA